MDLGLELFSAAAIAAVGAAGVAAFAFALLRWPLAPVVALLALSVTTEALRDPIVLTFSVGTANVRATDLAVLMLVGIASIRLAQARSRAAFVPAALLALVLIHLARGISAYGLEPAVNGARSWLYFAAAFVFAVSARRVWGRAAYNLLVAAGVLVAAVGLYNVAVYGVAQADSRILVDGVWIDGRSITAAGALIVLSALIVAVSTHGGRTFAKACGIAVTAAAVSLVPHRTIWVAGLASACVGFTVWVDATMRLAREKAYAITGCVLLAAPALIWAVSTNDLVRHSFAEATSENSTFGWRTESWTNLLAQNDSLADAIGGAPAGEGWERLVNGTLVDLSPHSGYLESYLRFGGPGLVLVGLIGWLAMRGARLADRPLPAAGLIALVVAQLIFGFAYQFAMVGGFILGMIAQGAVVRVPRPQVSPSPVVATPA